MARSKRSRSRSESPTSKPNGHNGATAVAEPLKPVITSPKPRTELNGPKPSRPAVHAHVSIPVSHDQIAVAAYHLWQQHGGTPESNWNKAETQLRKQAQINV